MITNGEKYACESCIRGHRVAQCQHTESGKRAVRYRSAIIVARYGPRDRFIQGVNADQPLGRQRSDCLVKSDASVVRAATARAPTRLVRHLHPHLQQPPISQLPSWTHYAQWS
ncbi:hypothetical protein CEP51_011026 [Fusarium floridanum]|uniref:Copper-fist domain-containing protein n=1 Tax=Fusarium floridanum TaxID=1325733 RepID=A0A428RCL5_9HYPO|nr:hypothetical protein CEP51_011026 [Fusarium floridanum]